MPLLDRTLDALGSLLTRRHAFFTDGVGDQALLREALRLTFDPPRAVNVRLVQTRRTNGHRRLDGEFASPVPHLLPPCSHRARIELLLPRNPRGAAVLHLAATGDGGMARRRHLMAAPLLADGCAAMLLENPYYGGRRPRTQRGAAVRTLADAAAMARAAVEEARSLLLWLHQRGFAPLGVTGVSMGGQIAAMAAATVELEVAAVPCVPTRHPGPAFSRGELSRAVDWRALERSWGAAARTRLEEILRHADVCRLPPPRRSDAAVIVAAGEDAFVPPAHAEAIHRHWPGSELRRLPTGHIGSVVRHHADLRQAVRDALDRVAIGGRDDCRGAA